jgi:cytochrome P450
MNHDGAHHRRLRGLVSKAFTPKLIAGLRPFIRARARQLAERLASVAECEFIEDFANPLPLAVMSEMLGVPPEDHGVFHTWTTDIDLVFSIALGGDVVARVESALVGLNEYIDALMARKKAAPAEALPALATRLAPPAVAGPFTWRPPIGIHGPNTLPLRFG